MAELRCRYCNNEIPITTAIAQLENINEYPTCCQCEYASEPCTNIIRSKTIPDYVCGRINCHKQKSGRYGKHISACYPRNCKSFLKKESVK